MQQVGMADSSPSHSSSSSSSSDNEEVQGDEVEVGSYSVPQSVLLTALIKLKEGELLLKSSKGPQVALLVDAFLGNMAAEEVNNFTDSTVRHIQSCLKANKAGKIPISKVWRNFHLLRLSSAIKVMWKSCTALLKLPEEVEKVSEVTLQLVLRRMMDSVIQQLSSSDNTCSRPLPTHVCLSLRECNVLLVILL